MRFLGLVEAVDLGCALAWEYPWLESRLFEAWQAVSTTTAATPSGWVRVARLDADLAEALYNGYVGSLRAGVPGADAADWTELQHGDWEHSRMLRAEDLQIVLGPSLDKRAVSQSRSRSQQLSHILAVEVDYVALVDLDHRFVSLVDRRAVLEERAAQDQEASSKPITDN
jgi:hypothetical protein